MMLFLSLYLVWLVSNILVGLCLPLDKMYDLLVDRQNKVSKVLVNACFFMAWTIKLFLD